MAGFLEARRVPSIRRIVRAPKRWPRLVELAKRYGESLPDEPSSLALAEFLRRRRAADPDTFADLSLSVVKLLGAGEYAVERPWEPDGEEGHFGLAVDDYSHTTAPNRRYADLVMQRLLKATLAGASAPYHAEELDAIADAMHGDGERRAEGRANDAESRCGNAARAVAWARRSTRSSPA